MTNSKYPELPHAEDAHNEGNVSGRRTEEQKEGRALRPAMTSIDKDFEQLRECVNASFDIAALDRIEAAVDQLNGDVPCSTCGTDVNPVWWVDSPLWNAVVRSDLSRWEGREPTLCPACFMRLLESTLSGIPVAATTPPKEGE
jgi:hypothetical protein